MAKTRRRLDEPLPRRLTGEKDSRGRFAPGNSLGRGNPVALKMKEYREGLALGATPDDLREIMAKLVTLAKRPSVAAAKVVFERLLGSAQAVDLLERIEILETLVLSQRK